MFRWLLAIALTLTLHAALLIFATPILHPQKPETAPVKFHIYQAPSQPRSSDAPSTQKQNLRGQIQKRAPKYRDLLPGGSYAATTEGANQPAEKTAHNKWLRDGKPAGQLSGAMTNFARILGDYIDVPQQLRKHYANGNASVTIVAKDLRDYQIQRASGDPYFRALAFERIKDILQTNGNTDDLSQAGIQDVRVALDFRKIVVHSHDDFRGELREIKIEGHQITLAFVELVIDANLAFGVPGENGGAPGMALDLIGAAVLAYKFFNPERLNPNDSALRDLRTSPAFIKPITR